MLATKMIRGNWYWLDHDFDINQHIKEVQENVPDLAGLQKFLSQLAGTGLNPDLPMWDVFLIPKFVCEDKVERSVIIFRLHHCNPCFVYIGFFFDKRMDRFGRWSWIDASVVGIVGPRRGRGKAS